MIKPVAWTNKWYVENGRDFRHMEAMPRQHPSFDIPLYAIPEGFAIVPVEPTEAMIEAGAAAHASILHGSCLTASDLASKLYKAMLTAAKGE